MNGWMNVQIRVLSAQATREMKKFESQVASTRNEVNRASAASANFPNRTGVQAFTKWGNQVQWAGRQLQYNFTLPILLAGGAATKFALDNEKAMKRVEKVYGDGSEAMNKIAETEIPALERAFTALSNKFGIARADAINIAADWAAAGASGLALAKSVELTMQTMILGEMDAAEATEALIAIQAQYGYDIKGLIRTIDTLNMVENQTGISMKGLVQGFQRAAGVARTAGIDVQHLGAMLAALVPATGSASQAGVALKTMISRLISPTKEANQVFAAMGINTADAGWQSMNATQRFEAMAKTFNKLPKGQRVVAAAVAASNWQISRFSVLMRDIDNPLGYYRKSLAATADETRNLQQRQKELNVVLSSNPQRLKQIWVILQNAMADVIQPMIPIILLLAGTVAKLATSFSNLDGEVQKLVLVGLLLLAAIGPIARYVGSVSVLLGMMHAATAKLVVGLGKLALILASPIYKPLMAMGFAAKWVILQFMAMGKAIAALKVMGLIVPAVTGLIATGLKAGAARVLLYGPAIVWSIVASVTGAAATAGPVLAARMGAFWALAMMPGAGVIRAASAYIYVFFATTIPLLLTRASGAVFRASVILWMGMQAALMASGTALIAGVGLVFSMASAAIYRAYALIFAASSVAFSAITAGLAASMVATRAFFLTLPAMAVAGMTMLSGAIAAGLVAIRAMFVAAWAATTAAWAAVWAARVLIAKLAMFRILLMIGMIMPLIMAAITSPFTYAALAVLGILYTFRDQIANVWNSVIRGMGGLAEGLGGVVDHFDAAAGYIEEAFWRLPEGIRDAMLTVIKIVATAAMKVYELFSYLNPFARHSPSLVDQVTAGMAEIKSQYASVGNVGAAFNKAARDLAAYKNAVASLGGGEFAEDRVEVGTAYPKLLPIFDALKNDLAVMNRLLAVQYGQVQAQQQVVDSWSSALDRANAALDLQQAKLDKARDHLDALNQAYAAHESALESYASAPIAGMGEMGDAIFANEMAQKQLRLEIMKWEQANGSIEDVKSNMAGLAGSIEALRGEAASLRMAGAGSDILGPINAQIQQMEDAYAAMGTAANNSPVNEMQQQLEDLQQQGEILDLENSIKFDPMIREIEKLASAQKELTYAQIVAGIKSEQAAMAALTPQIAAATAAVAAQQAAVDAATASRDAIQAAYDAESAKLDSLNQAYNRTEDAIREIESALSDMGSTAGREIARMEEAARAAKSAAEEAARAKKEAKGSDAYKSPGLINFENSAGGDWADPGDTGEIGRVALPGRPLMEDQSGAIDEFTKSLTDELAVEMGKLDMMKPIKEKWNQGWKWMEENIYPVVGAVRDGLVDAWEDVTDFFNGDGGDGISTAFDKIRKAGESLWNGIMSVIRLFKEDFIAIKDALVEAGKKIWTDIGPELEKLGPILPYIAEAFGFIAKVLGGVVLLALKVVTSILSNTLGPALDLIINIVENVIQMFRGLADMLIGLFTGDFKRVGDGFLTFFGGLIGGVLGIFRDLGKVLWGVVKGLVEGVWDFFAWLADELVGHSIIPDMINDIVEWFKGLPKKVWDAIVRLVNDVITVAKDMWDGFTEKSSEKWSAFITWLTERPKNAYETLKTLKDKLTNNASEAWDGFRTKASEKWGNFVTWLLERPMSAYNNLKILKDKLTNNASEAWNSFKTMSSTKWNEFITYLAGRPQNAYNNLVTLKDKLWEIARLAFQALRDKAGAMVDGKGGFMEWIRGIPGRVASAMSGIGSAVANAVKNAWNGVAKWISDNGIAAVNKVTTKFGFTLDRLPQFAGGGVIPGKVSRRDNTIIAARTGEGVIIPEAVRALGGARGIDQLNAAARSGGSAGLARLGIERFEGGGIIGKVTGWLQSGAGNALGKIFDGMSSGTREFIPKRPFIEDWLAGNLTNAAKKARQWGDEQETVGSGVLPGRGYQWQIKALHDRFPGAIVTSAFRPGAIAASGNTSMHAMGRAIDIAPRKSYFDWIHDTYGKNTAQLWYGPENGRNIRAGKEVTIGGALLADHWDHIHWGYDKGGILPPGLTMAYNGTGKDEVTLTNGDWQTFSNVVSLMGRVGQKSATAGTPGAGMVARTMASVTSLEAKLRQAETRSTTSTRYNGGGDTINNFYGDLSFPNVEDGSDAEDFLNNLKGLAG